MELPDLPWQLAVKLLIAIRFGTIEECRRILREGADPDQAFKINNMLKPALHLAMESSTSADIIELLLGAGGSINQLDSLGRTALHVAVEFGYETITEFLLRFNPNVNIPDSYGNTPLHYAVKRGSFYLAQLLVEQGGGNVCCKNLQGDSPLIILAKYSGCSFDVMQLLIRNGARANDANAKGISAIRLLIDSGLFNYNTIELLLRHGAIPFLLDNSRFTPFHLLVLSQNVHKARCIQLMYRYGCHANLNSRHFHTPLHLAVISSDPDIVKLFIRTGGRLNVKDSFGLAPLDYAFQYRIREIISILVKAGARMSVNKFDSLHLPWLSEKDKNYLRNKFGNPLSLMQTSRIAVWNLLGSTTPEKLRGRNRLPKTIINYLQLIQKRRNKTS